jgi:hypothetical protein
MLNFKAATLTPKEMEFLEFLAEKAYFDTALPFFPTGVASCRRSLEQ